MKHTAHQIRKNFRLGCEFILTEMPVDLRPILSAMLFATAIRYCGRSKFMEYMAVIYEKHKIEKSSYTDTKYVHADGVVFKDRLELAWQKKVEQLKLLTVIELSRYVVTSYSQVLCFELLDRCGDLPDQMCNTMHHHYQTYTSGKEVCVNCEKPTTTKCPSCEHFRFCANCWKQCYKHHLIFCAHDKDHATEK